MVEEMGTSPLANAPQYRSAIPGSKENATIGLVESLVSVQTGDSSSIDPKLPTAEVQNEPNTRSVSEGGSPKVIFFISTFPFENKLRS